MYCEQSKQKDFFGPAGPKLISLLHPCLGVPYSPVLTVVGSPLKAVGSVTFCMLLYYVRTCQCTHICTACRRHSILRGWGNTYGDEQNRHDTTTITVLNECQVPLLANSTAVSKTLSSEDYQQMQWGKLLTHI